MDKKSKSLLLLYVVAGALQVAGILLKIPLLHQSFKMLLMPILACYLWSGIGEKATSASFMLSMLAIIGSYAGDIFLMMPNTNPLFFIAGLVSFLVAHLCYTKLFTRLSPIRVPLLKKNLFWIIGLLLFMVSFLSYLIPRVDSHLKIPVITYALIICTMLFSAVNLKEKIEKNSYFMIVAGGLLFVLSDSILAINKFDPSFGNITLMNALVMITYISAQGFIIHGIITETRYSFLSRK